MSAPTQASEAVLCENDDHTRPAVARIAYPSGRFYPTTGCRADVLACVRAALDEGYPITITPLGGAS